MIDTIIHVDRKVELEIVSDVARSSTCHGVRLLRTQLVRCIDSGTYQERMECSALAFQENRNLCKIKGNQIYCP